MSTPERRRYPRLPYQGKGRIRVADGQETSTQLSNISPFGASLLFERSLVIGTPVELAFQLETDPATTLLMVHGEVQDCQTNIDAGPNCVRVRFVDPPLQAIETIRKFMQARSADEDVDSLGSTESE